ncbi:MAG: phosphoenolpyruvate synthase [bacterium]
MKFIKSFEAVGLKDIPLVGGKNASLGEMIKNLSPQGILVPLGFAVTSQAYWHYLKQNKLDDKIKNLLNQLDKKNKNLKQLEKVGKQIRSLIEKATLPKDLEEQIVDAYEELEKKYGKNCDVAVRSSATAEDLPEASFAGQQETFLNIQGQKNLLDACKKSFASLFTDRAISYRQDHGFDHMDVALSIGVQKMVRSDLASAGVIFTLDTESGFKDVVLINSSYGLGESVVKGVVNPDEFYVHKPTLEKNFKPVLKKRLGSKKSKLIYSKTGEKIKTVAVSENDQKLFSLTDEEILKLAEQALLIEKHYSKIKNRWMPMDIEWAKDGKDGKIYILQARPETVHSLDLNKNFIQEYVLKKDKDLKNKILVTGKGVGRKIVSGIARVINSAKEISKIKKGEILITDMTDPDWEPAMKIAAGIVTNRGGRTCHASIVSRELGIPAIVGTHDATKKIKTGQQITIDCSSGETGVIYSGKIPFIIEKIELKKLPKPPVELMLNVADPDQAFNFALLPQDGVGLARIEFIINNSIKIHPNALIYPEKIKDKKIKKEIENLTFSYKDKKQFYVDTLAQEAGTIAAAFWPKPVIIRMSDFKSNEYRELIGGKYFEPEEENPMLGFRGACRYYNEQFKHAFALECLAMKKIRQEMGLTNVKLMIPFVRTIDDAMNVIKEMTKYDLVQKKDGLQIYMMCEIPSNVLLIDDFSEIFDGFSIGSNDLTQTILAVDRDSQLVSNLFDERNKAVKLMMMQAIKGARKNNKKIGICGQAPSDFPELAEFLIKQGINSISLNPDSLLRTLIKIK